MASVAGTAPLPPASIVGTALSGAATSGVASQPSGGNGQAGSDSHSFEGPASPRAARSQISTAVSFEGGRAAGSVALPSRSLDGESALSAAEGDDVSQDQGAAAAGPSRLPRAVPVRPSNSLISTAVQPASPRGDQPPSPKVNRATSVVSQTPYHRSLPRTTTRAGTPGSVYGQGGAVAGRALRGSSPAGSLAGAEQMFQSLPAEAGMAPWPPGMATRPGMMLGHPAGPSPHRPAFPASPAPLWPQGPMPGMGLPPGLQAPPLPRASSSAAARPYDHQADSLLFHTAMEQSLQPQGPGMASQGHTPLRSTANRPPQPAPAAAAAAAAAAATVASLHIAMASAAPAPGVLPGVSFQQQAGSAALGTQLDHHQQQRRRWRQLAQAVQQHAPGQLPPSRQHSAAQQAARQHSQRPSELPFRHLQQPEQQGAAPGLLPQPQQQHQQPATSQMQSMPPLMLPTHEGSSGHAHSHAGAGSVGGMGLQAAGYQDQLAGAPASVPPSVFNPADSSPAPLQANMVPLEPPAQQQQEQVASQHQQNQNPPSQNHNLYQQQQQASQGLPGPSTAGRPSSGAAREQQHHGPQHSGLQAAHSGPGQHQQQQQQVSEPLLQQGSQQGDADAAGPSQRASPGPGPGLAQSSAAVPQQQAQQGLLQPEQQQSEQYSMKEHAAQQQLQPLPEQQQQQQQAGQQNSVQQAQEQLSQQQQQQQQQQQDQPPHQQDMEQQEQQEQQQAGHFPNQVAPSSMAIDEAAANSVHIGVSGPQPTSMLVAQQQAAQRPLEDQISQHWPPPLADLLPQATAGLPASMMALPPGAMFPLPGAALPQGQMAYNQQLQNALSLLLQSMSANGQLGLLQALANPTSSYAGSRQAEQAASHMLSAGNEHAPGGEGQADNAAGRTAHSRQPSAGAQYADGGGGGSECMGPPVARRPSLPNADGDGAAAEEVVHPAASVHATVVAEGEGASHENSEVSSLEGGASQPDHPAVAAEAEIVSGRCAGSHSHSASPPAAPATAMATGQGPASVCTGVASGDTAPAMQRDSSMGMATARHRGMGSNVPSCSGTVDMSGQGDAAGETDVEQEPRKGCSRRGSKQSVEPTSCGEQPGRSPQHDMQQQGSLGGQQLQPGGQQSGYNGRQASPAAAMVAPLQPQASQQQEAEQMQLSPSPQRQQQQQAGPARAADPALEACFSGTQHLSLYGPGAQPGPDHMPAGQQAGPSNAYGAGHQPQSEPAAAPADAACNSTAPAAGEGAGDAEPMERDVASPGWARTYSGSNGGGTKASGQGSMQHSPQQAQQHSQALSMAEAEGGQGGERGSTPPPGHGTATPQRSRHTAGSHHLEQQANGTVASMAEAAAGGSAGMGQAGGQLAARRSPGVPSELLPQVTEVHGGLHHGTTLAAIAAEAQLHHQQQHSNHNLPGLHMQQQQQQQQHSAAGNLPPLPTRATATSPAAWPAPATAAAAAHGPVSGSGSRMGWEVEEGAAGPSRPPRHHQAEGGGRHSQRGGLTAEGHGSHGAGRGHIYWQQQQQRQGQPSAQQQGLAQDQPQQGLQGQQLLPPLQQQLLDPRLQQQQGSREGSRPPTNVCSQNGWHTPAPSNGHPAGALHPADQEPFPSGYHYLQNGHHSGQNGCHSAMNGYHSAQNGYHNGMVSGRGAGGQPRSSQPAAAMGGWLHQPDVHAVPQLTVMLNCAGDQGAHSTGEAVGSRYRSAQPAGSSQEQEVEEEVGGQQAQQGQEEEEEVELPAEAQQLGGAGDSGITSPARAAAARGRRREGKRKRTSFTGDTGDDGSALPSNHTAS